MREAADIIIDSCGVRAAEVLMLLTTAQAARANLVQGHDHDHVFDKPGRDRGQGLSIPAMEWPARRRQLGARLDDAFARAPKSPWTHRASRAHSSC